MATSISDVLLRFPSATEPKNIIKQSFFKLLFIASPISLI